MIGALFGALAAWYWPVTYTSRLSFVVEDNKAGGGSMISALAGEFGLLLRAESTSTGMLDTNWLAIASVLLGTRRDICTR